MEIPEPAQNLVWDDPSITSLWTQKKKSRPRKAFVDTVIPSPLTVPKPRMVQGSFFFWFNLFFPLILRRLMSADRIRTVLAWIGGNMVPTPV